MKLVTFNAEGRALSVFSVWPEDYEAHLESEGVPYSIVPEDMDARAYIYAPDAHPVPRPDCHIEPVVAGQVISVPPETEWYAKLPGLAPIKIDGTSVEVDPGPVSIRIVPAWPYKEAVYDLTIE